MTHSLSVVVTAVAVSGVLVAVAACSSAPTPNPSGGTGTSGGSLGDDDDDTPPAGGTSGTTPNDAGRTEAGPTDTQCTAGPAAACPNCCTVAHKKGSDHYDSALVKCICTAPGACQTECANTLCATPRLTPVAACDTCIRGAVAGTCKTQLETECAAEPDCVAVNACINQCP